MPIPVDFVNYKNTAIFNGRDLPEEFLQDHNCKKGVYAKISVLQGKIKFIGLKGEGKEIDQVIIIRTGQEVIVPPQYWHRIEFTDENSLAYAEYFAQRDSDLVKKSMPQSSQ